MRIEPQFDPVFAREDRRADDPARTEHLAFAFDGWSCQPIAAPRDARAAAVTQPAR